MSKQDWIIAAVIAVTIAIVSAVFGVAPSPATASSAGPGPDYLRAVYSPLHFRPAAELATDDQCLACHREIMESRVRDKSPAGLPAKEAKAWYQQLSTYAGEQETFHRRHLSTPMAKQLMKRQGRRLTSARIRRPSRCASR